MNYAYVNVVDCNLQVSEQWCGCAIYTFTAWSHCLQSMWAERGRSGAGAWVYETGTDSPGDMCKVKKLYSLGLFTALCRATVKLFELGVRSPTPCRACERLSGVGSDRKTVRSGPNIE